MSTLSRLILSSAVLAHAASLNHGLPSRYNGSLAGATFVYSVENGGVATPPSQYENVYIQAIDGHLVFTQNPPSRICPCSKTFGAQNFTGYYVGGTSEAPTLQLFTSSLGAQQVYVAPDLTIRYTLPGEPVPRGANSTSIFFFDPEPLGDGLPSTGAANIQGHVTQLDGSRTYYNGIQFCAPPDAPPRTQDGVGPLKILVTRTEGNDPEGNGIISKHCVSGIFENSINDPKVAPYDIVFNTPSEPLAFAYTV